MKEAFTLAEVLITLAIIGVVAALVIPGVISNSQQQEFRTGLRKAVSVLNSAISINMALDGESPYDNKDLWNYLQKHMSIMKTTTRVPWYGTSGSGPKNINSNSAFYTTDGMRFEFDDGAGMGESVPLHESEYLAHPVNMEGYFNGIPHKGCGSLGLKTNPNMTTETPCIILVDVNGDRKPTPANIACQDTSCFDKNVYRVPTWESKKINDIFLILITEDRAIPYGVTAQKAMYEAQK